MDPGGDAVTLEARLAWVARVLGVQAGGAAARAEPGEALAVWRDAKDRIDTQLEALRRALMGTGHPSAQAACDKGLAAFSGGVLIRFQVAVMAWSRARDGEKEAAATRLRKLAGQLNGFIGSSRMLPVLERNPFGIALSIRSEVAGATARILDLATEAGHVR